MWSFGNRSLLGLLIRINDVAGLQIGRRQDRLIAHPLPGLEAGAFLDVVVLHLKHAGLGPFAVRTVAPVAHNGLELVLAQIVRDLGVLDALGAFDRLTEHGDVSKTPTTEIVAERIGALGAGTRLI